VQTTLPATKLPGEAAGVRYSGLVTCSSKSQLRELAGEMPAAPISLPGRVAEEPGSAHRQVIQHFMPSPSALESK